jgi:hypothetical protein
MLYSIHNRKNETQGARKTVLIKGGSFMLVSKTVIDVFAEVVQEVTAADVVRIAIKMRPDGFGGVTVQPVAVPVERALKSEADWRAYMTDLSTASVFTYAITQLDLDVIEMNPQYDVIPQEVKIAFRVAYAKGGLTGLFEALEAHTAYCLSGTA